MRYVSPLQFDIVILRYAINAIIATALMSSVLATDVHLLLLLLLLLFDHFQPGVFILGMPFSSGKKLQVTTLGHVVS